MIDKALPFCIAILRRCFSHMDSLFSPVFSEIRNSRLKDLDVFKGILGPYLKFFHIYLCLPPFKAFGKLDSISALKFLTHQF